MIRLFISCILIFISHTVTYAFKLDKRADGWPREYINQESPRWFWGGSLLIQPLDSNGYHGYISPSLAYRAGNRSIFIFNLGINYYQEKIYHISPNWSDNKFYKYQETTYEASVAWRYFFYWRFFTHLGIANYNVKNLTRLEYDFTNDVVNEVYTRENIIAAPLGIGYVQPLGQNSSLVITCLYDVLQNKRSPYRGKPILRAGFNFGL